MHKMNPSKSHASALKMCFVVLCYLIPAGATGQSSFEGTYVLWQRTVSETKLPLLKDVTATTTAISLIQLTQNGNHLDGSGLLCDLRLESTSSLVKTTFPDAFLKALPKVTFDANLEKRGDRPYLVSTEQTLVLGAQLEHPRTDRLPKLASDPAVYDQDHDGFPGMTVQIRGIVTGEVYLVQRTKERMSGRATSEGFAGGIHYELEQHVIGASSAMLKHGPNPVANSNASSFVLRRVASSTNCGQAESFF